MSDYLLSLIRTAVPAGVGIALGWLTARGLTLDEASSAALTAAATGIATAVYYAVVRAAETRWPWLGVLLGAPRAPVYQPRSEARS